MELIKSIYEGARGPYWFGLGVALVVVFAAAIQ